MTVIIGTVVLVIALLCILLLFLIFPRFTERADMELLRTNYAHRGLWDARIPENSLPAFARAVQHGYGIELDVQRTRDGRLIILHDDTLLRSCGVNKRPSELTYDELRLLRIRGTDLQVPSLAEVLRLVDGRVPLMIEVKGLAVDKVLCEGLTRLLDRYMGPFCIESFSPLILRWFKHHRPSYARGQLVTRMTKAEHKSNFFIRFCATNMIFNHLSRPDFISMNIQSRRRLTFFICHRLLHTDAFLWTVRNEEEMEICRKMGMGAIFDGFLPTKPNKK